MIRVGGSGSGWLVVAGFGGFYCLKDVIGSKVKRSAALQMRCAGRRLCYGSITIEKGRACQSSIFASRRTILLLQNETAVK